MNDQLHGSQSGAGLPTGQAGSNLQTAIRRTIAYYDIFDFPLTIEEVRHWLYQASGEHIGVVTKEAIRQEVEVLQGQKKLEGQDGFIFFPGRASIVGTRKERAERSVRLWNRASSTARYLELVPFIRMVAVVNTLAISNVRPESDIDLFIVTAPQHIWITRMIVTGIVSLMGNRRHGKKIAGRICLSFYLTTDALDLASLQSEQPDTYLAMWAAQMVPLLDNGTYEKFQQANRWVNNLLPQAWSWDWKAKLLAPNAGLLAIKQFYELFFSTPIGHWFESLARDRQLKKMEKNIHSRAALGTTEVIISEDVLKFHEADRRKEYNEKFRQRCLERGIPV